MKSLTKHWVNCDGDFLPTDGTKYAFRRCVLVEKCSPALFFSIACLHSLVVIIELVGKKRTVSNQLVP